MAGLPVQVELTAMMLAIRRGLEFIRDITQEAMDDGDVKVGQAAEIAMRHANRRARECLEAIERALPT